MSELCSEHRTEQKVSYAQDNDFRADRDRGRDRDREYEYEYTENHFNRIMGQLNMHLCPCCSSE